MRPSRACAATCYFPSTVGSLPAREFTPTKQQLKTLKHMEQFLSGQRPITKVKKTAKAGGAR